MKVLILGGTGFFGKTCVMNCLNQGHDVTLLTRGNSKPAIFWDDIQHLACDRTNQAVMKATLTQSHDTVIDNTAMTAADVNNVLEIMHTWKQPSHYILCSTIGVYAGGNMDGLLRESDPIVSGTTTDATSRYHTYIHGKQAAEHTLLNNHRTIPYTILRPTVIEGKTDPTHRMHYFINKIKNHETILLSNAEKDTRYRHVLDTDVARAFTACINNPNANNEIFNVAGDDILTIEHYLETLAKALNLSANIRFTHETDPALQELTHQLPAFYSCVRLIPDINKIKNTLHFEPTPTHRWLPTLVAQHND